MDSVSTVDLVWTAAVAVSVAWVWFQALGLWRSWFFWHLLLMLMRSPLNPSIASRRAARFAYSDPFIWETHLSSRYRADK